MFAVGFMRAQSLWAVDVEPGWLLLPGRICRHPAPGTWRCQREQCSTCGVPT